MSDQYVRVPRELLERINTQLSEDWDRIDGEWGPSGYTLDQEVVRGEQPVIAELRALLDAPAEDVRAVVEEPVAFKLKECADGYGHGGHWCGAAYNCWLDPRDRKERDEDFERRKSAASQRPVVLPTLDHFQKWKDDEKLEHTPYWAWRAAIDAVEELNKC